MNNYYPDIKIIHVTFKLTNSKIIKRFLYMHFQNIVAKGNDIQK